MGDDRDKQAAGKEEGRKPWALREISGKTIWDWIQLVGVLAIPVVLGVGGCMVNAQQDTRQQQLEDQRAEAEREIAEQSAQDEQLQAYLDQMSTLLIGKDLSDDKVQILIHARTVTVLSGMDPGRKTQVVQFLDGADLLQERVDEGISTNVEGPPALSITRVDESSAAISLEDADLSGADLIEVRLFRADLTQADLSNAKLHYAEEARLVEADLTNADLADTVAHSHLRGADLSRADLSDANLIAADLTDANLTDANLTDANLTNANLTDANLTNANLTNADLTGANVAPEQLEGKVASLRGATLPNGQKYED